MLGLRRKRIKSLILGRKSTHGKDDDNKTGFYQPSVYHALVIIFLEFFAWGLLMSPVITVLDETFPNDAFLMNGLIQGVKGLLSFLSAPLIGALSDVWGRKPFLLLTVTFTCAPIPLMKFSPMWYFAITSLSGIFSVTFSIVFAYVSDVTTAEERSAAYGLVSATFAASLVTSPAIGAYLGALYGENLVVAVATAIALLDILFIMVAVPESISETAHPEVHQNKMSWERADPFASLKRIGKDHLILMLCVTVFLSYLPEAGEYSSFFVYLRLVMDFSPEKVAAYVAMIGVLSCLAQTALLALLMKQFGNKHTMIVGLTFEMIQLLMIGFFSQHWLLWMAGAVSALGSITYPAISVFVSAHASPDQQGVAQGVITGIRGLCNGLGPALYGFIFYLFGVDIAKMPPSGSLSGSMSGSVSGSVSGSSPSSVAVSHNRTNTGHDLDTAGVYKVVPGPPFVFGGILVIIAILVATYMPNNPGPGSGSGVTESIEIDATGLSEPLVSRNKREKELLMSSEDES